MAKNRNALTKSKTLQINYSERKAQSCDLSKPLKHGDDLNLPLWPTGTVLSLTMEKVFKALSGFKSAV